MRNRTIKRKQLAKARKNAKNQVKYLLKRYRINEKHLLVAPQRKDFVGNMDQYIRFLEKYNKDLLDYTAYKMEMYKAVMEKTTNGSGKHHFTRS